MVTNQNTKHMKTEETTELSQAEWNKHVEAFQWEEGLITFHEAEVMMLDLIKQGKLERPTRCL